MLYTDDNGLTFYYGNKAGGREATATEVAHYEVQRKPKEVSRAQFFAALITMNLDVIVDNAVMASGDKLLINDYKNRLTFRRDWPSFIAMATALNFTSADIDALFALADTL